MANPREPSDEKSTTEQSLNNSEDDDLDYNPFVFFTEWASEADCKGFADL